MKRRTVSLLTAILIVSAIFLATTAIPAMAQEVGTPEPAAPGESSDPEAFLPFLFAVYTITWVGFFAYLYFLSSKQRALTREVEELRKALAERGGQSGSALGGG